MPRQRDETILFGVGQILRHDEHGLCVVYGWERCSLNLAEATRCDVRREIVDNRRHFAGVDAGLAGSASPHFRCLFERGEARVCDGARLRAGARLPRAGIASAPRVSRAEGVCVFARRRRRRDPVFPLKRSLAQQVGSSAFFRGAAEDRLLPSAALAKLYPLDEEFVAQLSVTTDGTAEYSRQFLQSSTTRRPNNDERVSFHMRAHSNRNARRGRRRSLGQTLGDEIFRAAIVPQPSPSPSPPDGEPPQSNM